MAGRFHLRHGGRYRIEVIGLPPNTLAQVVGKIRVGRRHTGNFTAGFLQAAQHLPHGRCELIGRLFQFNKLAVGAECQFAAIVAPSHRREVIDGGTQRNTDQPPQPHRDHNGNKQN